MDAVLKKNDAGRGNEYIGMEKSLRATRGE
jgi:hypothetical protein